MHIYEKENIQNKLSVHPSAGRPSPLPHAGPTAEGRTPSPAFLAPPAGRRICTFEMCLYLAGF